jgi:hypothetical protein
MISRTAMTIAGAVLVAIGGLLFVFSHFVSGTTLAVVGVTLELVGVIA